VSALRRRFEYEHRAVAAENASFGQRNRCVHGDIQKILTVLGKQRNEEKRQLPLQGRRPNRARTADLKNKG
jgi:hypothetical protein